MKYRGRLDILYSILNALEKEPINKTKIMYATYLSYTQLMKNLATLEKKDMIIHITDTIYSITPKGLQYTDIYRQLIEVIGDLRNA